MKIQLKSHTYGAGRRCPASLLEACVLHKAPAPVTTGMERVVFHIQLSAHINT